MKPHAALAFVVAFFYQWTRPAFSNDHFEILAKAQQLLHGEWPIRDFFDNGRPLSIALSALALHLSGGRLLGEALLTITAISLAVALVCVLTRELSGSWVAAAGAVFGVIAIEPRLYNYPKVLVVMGGVVLAFRFIDRPGARRAAMVGAWAGIGFLFRHDIGVYLAALTITAFALATPRSPTLLMRHVAIAVGSGGLVVAPYIWYLFAAGALGQVAGDGGNTMLGAAEVTLRPFTFTNTASGDAWTRVDAQTWVYDCLLAAPLATAVVLWRRRGRLTSTDRKAGALAILCATLVLFLVRGNLDSRLSDVTGASFVLIGWLLAEGWATRHQPMRMAVLAIATLTVLAAGEIGGNPPRRLAHAVRTLPGSVTYQARLLAGSPVAWYESDGLNDVRGLAHWLRECTPADARVLVFGYYPDVVFFSQRPFAGGQPFLHSGYYSSDAEQRLTVERLARQRVPFVIVERADAPALDGTYAIVGAYVKANYARVAESAFDGPRRFAVYQRNTLGLGRRDDGLPCFR